MTPTPFQHANVTSHILSSTSHANRHNYCFGCFYGPWMPLGNWSKKWSVNKLLRLWVFFLWPQVEASRQSFLHEKHIPPEKNSSPQFIAQSNLFQSSGTNYREKCLEESGKTFTSLQCIYITNFTAAGTYDSKYVPHIKHPWYSSPRGANILVIETHGCVYFWKSLRHIAFHWIGIMATAMRNCFSGDDKQESRQRQKTGQGCKKVKTPGNDDLAID